jgi:hypothetical protein
VAEFKKEISITAIVAAVAAVGFGIVAVMVFPSSPSGFSIVSSTTTTNGPTTELNLVPLTGLVSAQNVSCSLATGVCAFTIVNNGTASLEMESCKVVVTVSLNSTISESNLVNGTTGGPATAGIPANSRANATCAIQVSQLAHQQVGSFANGAFTVKLVDNWSGYPAGTESIVDFGGTWS